MEDLKLNLISYEISMDNKRSWRKKEQQNERQGVRSDRDGDPKRHWKDNINSALK